MDLQQNWRFVADEVMGGVSTGQVRQVQHAGRQATQLTGAVSLENNGGFIQMSMALGNGTAPRDASQSTGIEIDVAGNGETYDLRLRTDQLSRPWQSYRAAFTARLDWETLQFPFAGLTPHRTDIPFDPARLQRIGIVAVGRAFDVDVKVARLRFYR